ncbi:MAG: helix-turn-helix transcriptional regulator [Sneathiella sp.]|nr:helix-turn-helix transcriptional regulator [Sneathiella sp.]
MDKAWGSRLKEAISSKGFNKLSAVAAELDVNESTVSQWSAGNKISITHAILLCDTLDISMDWLFRNVNDVSAHQDNLEDIAEIAKLSPHARRALTNFLNSLT